MRVPRTVRNIGISIVVMVLIFIIAGVVYVYFSGGQMPKKQSAQKAQQDTTPSLFKPTAPSPNAPEGVAMENLTSPVPAGQNVSAQIRTNPASACTIAVTYADGVASKDSGLAPKTADIYGFITWSWTVGPTVPAGTYPVQVNCSYNGRSGMVIGDLQVTH